MNGGKYYKEAESVDQLADMFPYIVTESTSTSLGTQYLTEGSILRDIMGAGFLLTDGCTITATTQDGTWTPIGDDDSKQGTIAWAAGEQPFAELTVDKLDELTMSNIEDRIQIYNTNPDPVNGNFYRQDNLTAPPTIDVTGFDYEEQYLAVDHPGQKLVVTSPVWRLRPWMFSTTSRTRPTTTSLVCGLPRMRRATAS